MCERLSQDGDFQLAGTRRWPKQKPSPAGATPGSQAQGEVAAESHACPRAPQSCTRLPPPAQGIISLQSATSSLVLEFTFSNLSLTECFKPKEKLGGGCFPTL